MTTDEFTIHQEAPKDRWGRYKITDPVSGKDRGYTRVTTIAKTMDDTGSLADWKTRMAITGLVKRPDLLAQASTSLDDRGKLNRLAEDAIQAAGAYGRANLGTALHAITEQLDLGLKPDILPQLQADIDAYMNGVAGANFTMHHEYIEVLLINDEHEYAGTADRIVTLPDGRMVIFDLKTGTDLSYSYGNIAVQLAAYANAEWVYDWRTGERTPMPDIDKTEGIICHLPAGEARCEFHTVDLTAGYEALNMSFHVRNWRKRKGLFSPYQAVANVGARDIVARRDWVKARISNLTKQGQTMLVTAWPDNTPKLQECNHTQLDALIGVLTQIETVTDAPFTHTDPTTPTPPNRLRMFKTGEPVDDGSNK
jgi:hypothetical protein